MLEIEIDYNLMPEAHPEDETTKLEWIELLFDKEIVSESRNAIILQ